MFVDRHGALSSPTEAGRSNALRREDGVFRGWRRFG
jgi:hypothetical protein